MYYDINISKHMYTHGKKYRFIYIFKYLILKIFILINTSLYVYMLISIIICIYK